MPISFGRKKAADDGAVAAPAAPASEEFNASLVKDLESAAGRRFTGALEVVERAHGGRARIYMYEGGLYSVALDGFTPDVVQRLRASGALDEGRADYLATVARPGPTAVDQGWVSVEALATVHQEFLLAALGAVLACERVKVHARKGEVASDLCTLPLPIEPILQSVRVRAQRMSAAWPSLSEEATPATAVLRATGSGMPAALALPEFAALRAAVDGRRTVDEVAGACGLTRAEAVHLAALLAGAGVLAAAPASDAAPPPAALAVPEAFGTVTVPVAPDRPTAPEPEPEPVVVAPVVVAPVVVVPEPEPEPEPVVVAPVVVVPEPVVVVAVPEPEPEPELVVVAPVVVVPEPEPEPEPEPQPEPVVAQPDAPPTATTDGDEHVRMLRRELLRDEVAELREALDAAVVAEREAIVNASAVRARLREAEAALAELGGGE